MDKVKKIYTRNEFYTAALILVLAVFIELRSGLFFTSNNILDILRAMIVPGMLGLSEYIVMVSGGCDVSFPYSAALSMYSTIILLKAVDFMGNVMIAFLLSCLFGIVIGMVNGLIIMRYRFPVLIVTLATCSICQGILFGILNAHEIPAIPQPIQSLAKSMLIRTYSEKAQMAGSLPLVFLVFFILTAAVWFLMRRTAMGRSIFAVGGDVGSAERIGIKVNYVYMFIYGFAGFIAGLTGMTRVVLMDTCHPNTFSGMDMTVIAAVILGGTKVTGGSGSITGVMLGTLLFVIVNNSLQLMGIPNYWQKFFLGVLIVLGTGIAAFQVSRKRKKGKAG